MSGLITGETAAGKIRAIRVSEEGEVVLSAGSVGGDASAARQDEQTVHLADIASKVTGVAKDASVVATAAAVAALGGGKSLNDLVTTLASEASSQAIIGALTPLSSRASEATAQDILAALGPLATSLDAAATVAAITALGGSKTLGDIHTALLPLATEATSSAIRAELLEQGLSLDAVVTTLETIESEVDDLEPDVDATRVAAQSIDAKMLTPLGSIFAPPVRGSATAAAAQLPSSSTPRGFTLENIDASADLWVGTDNTVTTANGFRIAPSRSRFFDLGNPNNLWVISATTTAWQIGAVA